MKKKLIIISVMILVLGVIMGSKQILKKEMKGKESAFKGTYQRERKLYVSNVPSIDQEYTITTNYESNNIGGNIAFMETEEEIRTEVYEEPLKTEVVEEKTPDVNVLKPDEEIIPGIEDNQEKEILGNEQSVLVSDDIKDSINLDNKEPKVKTENKEQILEDKNKKEPVEDTIPKEPVEEPTKPDLKNGFYDEEGNTYYYEDDIKVTGLKNIDGINHYFSPLGKYLGTNNIKVIDVSYYQKDIDWDTFAHESDCYGVILRLGYYETLDKKFERNINELKRLNIPYGIYLFSYASTLNGAKKEADFTNRMITKYDINPTLGIYYDIESWNTKNSNSNNISKSMYDNIIQHYINSVSYYTNYKYKVKVYSGRWYAMNRLGSISKKYVDWVAEYNKTCKYDDIYSMWQYTSKGKVPGIEGNVDISYILQ